MELWEHCLALTFGQYIGHQARSGCLLWRSGELLLCAATEVESDGTHCTESYKQLSHALLTHEGMLSAPFCEADRPNIGNAFSPQTRPLADTDPPWTSNPIALLTWVIEMHAEASGYPG